MNNAPIKENVPKYKPKNILEVGTAYAFSTILMCETIEDANVTTIERDGWMAKHARENIADFNLEERIKLLEGDGVEMLKSLDENEKKYDFIFIDASKSHYNEFMKECKRLIAPRGLIVCDNVLRFTPTRLTSDQLAAMHAANENICTNAIWRTCCTGIFLLVIFCSTNIRHKYC